MTLLADGGAVRITLMIGFLFVFADAQCAHLQGLCMFCVLRTSVSKYFAYHQTFCYNKVIMQANQI